jgi:hypothetical protein
MRKYFSLLFFLLCFSGFSQTVFSYEKEIENKEKYIFSDIQFYNSVDKIHLFGTLITPKQEYSKIVIIVPGSGKDTRNSHYYLAEELLKNNVAVFRYDDRGIGQSEGKYSELVAPLSADLNFGFQKIKTTFPKKEIGIIGHSIGGIATLSFNTQDIRPNFIVLIETPIIKDGAFVFNQLKMDYDNALPSQLKENKSKEEILNFLKGYFKVISESNIKGLKSNAKKYIKNEGFNSKFIYLLKDDFLIEMLHTNNEETVKKTNIKTLFLTGTHDKTIEHKAELQLINSFHNQNIETQAFENLNHYLTKENAPVGTSLYLMDNKPLQKIISFIIN